jgi:hypothetical protein
MESVFPSKGIDTDTHVSNNLPNLSKSQSELELHRRILESILTSQIKIIELLQRK